MNVETIDALPTLAAAVVFVLIFFGQSWWRAPAFGRARTRRIISFSVGMAVAYVFVHLLPELAGAATEFAEINAESGLLLHPHLTVYCAALLGFMLFYGLEHLGGPRTAEGEKPPRKELHVRALTWSYALYVFVVCYLMAHEMRAGGGQLALYALAMGLHFVGFAYSLRRDDAAVYDRWGRNVLAASALTGWAVALLMPLPETFSYTLLGFVAGALIMDTVTSELAEQAEGRFVPFFAGGVAYTAVLVLIAH